MQPFALRGGRQTRRICRDVIRLGCSGQTSTRPYNTPTICVQCAARLSYLTSSPRTFIKPLTPRSTRSISTTTQTSSADSTPSNESPPRTHYTFFPKTLPGGPPPGSPFKINTRTLRQEFLQLQATAHPDKHAPHLKARAEATSSAINEAYKTLSSPLLRAQYLLSLRGINVAEDESAKVEDNELLMTVLEVREAVEEAEDESELEGLKRENDERIVEAEDVLERAFKEGDLERAKDEAVRLRYWVNVKESLDNWERGKGVVLEH